MRHAALWCRAAAAAVVVSGLAGCEAASRDPFAPTRRDERPAAAVAISSTDYSDGAGKAWRQLITTTGVSWDQVAAVCPRDGRTPCSGSAGARDLTGWVWATAPQVVQLIGTWAPSILASPTMQDNTVFGGIGWTEVFQPTQWFANTYQSSQYAAGWTASTDDAGLPLGAGGGWSTPPHAGGVGIGPIANPALTETTRGVMLWRANGSDGRGISAAPDSGAVDAPAGGVAIVNVLANDVLAGDTAQIDVVTLTQTSSSTAGVTLSTETGAVSVAEGTPAGSATLTYRVCEVLNPSNCAAANVTVTIRGNVIIARNDAGTTTTQGGVAIVDVRANDTAPVPVTLTAVAPLDPALALDTGSGRVSVAAGTTAGTRSMQYRLCETASPTNCATATAAITITSVPIDAVNDAGSAPSSTGGTAVPSVLSNDRLGPSLATLTTVTLEPVATGHAGITLDRTDGSVDVASQTPAGSFPLTYRSCERAMPTNCDQATVTVVIAAQSAIVTPSALTVREGASGSFTVRLSQLPVAPVSVSVTHYAGTVTVAPSPAVITFTAANWNVPVTVTFTAPKDSDKIDDAATMHVTILGGATVPVVARILDVSRAATDPTATITAPMNGQTVSGLVPLTGTGTDTNGQVVEGRFLVDGNRIYTDVNSTGRYQVPSRWNSATVANGWHTLELRVTDNAGKSGRMNIRVLVAN